MMRVFILMLSFIALQARAGDLYLCKTDAPSLDKPSGHKFEIDLRTCKQVDATGFVCNQSNLFYYIDVGSNSFYIKYPLANKTLPQLDMVDNMEVGYCTADE